MIKNDLILKAAKRQPTERTPIWIMRQAGRYLPEYRAVRAKADFLTLCKTPELASEVTIQPVDIIGVDAAIIFSDILVVPEAMGMELVVEEGKSGPQFPSPIRTSSDIDKLAIPDPSEKLKYVMDALSLSRKNLADPVPLIGFSGAPWTLATYMVEGKGKENFKIIKDLITNRPKDAHKLLEKLTKSVTNYLSAQIEAGAQVLQIFDTWGGTLTPDRYLKFSLDPMFNIVSTMRRESAPVIVFSKGANHALREIGQIGADVIGIDWTIDMAEARALTEDRVALQGNLDPSFLYASPEAIRNEVRTILRSYGNGPGHIFNLGHGILPDVPVEHARALVRAVKEESPVFHQ